MKRVLMNDISAMKTVRAALTPEHAATCVVILCVAALLCICVIPLQQGWNHADTLYCCVIPAIAATAIIMCALTASYPKFGVQDILVSVLYGYFIIRYYMDPTYPAESICIHASLAMALYLSLRLTFAASRINGNVLTLILLIFATYEAGGGIVQLLTGASRHDLYPVTGSFHNPGPYSCALAIGLTIICSYLKYPPHQELHQIPEKWEAPLNSVMQGLAIIFGSLIIITMSRTAIIASAISLLIIFRNDLGRRKWIVVGILTALCAVLYFLKSGSADGRMVINYVGLHALSGNPLFGSGTGSFFHKFGETTQELAVNGSRIDLNSVDVIEYAFNDWLRIAVELGFAGLTLAAAIAAVALRNLWRDCRRLFLALLVIIIFSVFSYPMELLPYRIITILILSFSASQCKRESPRKRCTWVLTAIAAIVAIFIPAANLNQVKVLVTAENDYNGMRGIDDPALIKDYQPLLPLLEENRNFLFDYARLLAKSGRHNDSNDILRRGAMVSNDPMFLVIQGNNYREMGAAGEAEELYHKAWHLMPNRIYPLYRLMLLYQQTGRDSTALRYALKVSDFKEKIPSPAVRDMKREAREIINNNKPII